MATPLSALGKRLQGQAHIVHFSERVQILRHALEIHMPQRIMFNVRIRL